MSRILITGGSGLLALNWACCMRQTHELVLAQHARKIRLAGVTALPLDLESVDALCGQIESARPDAVIHTAGITSVDRCEQQPELAMHVNAELARNVASAAHELNIKLVHISTDHLFDGARALATEDEPPAPLNAYARTKLAAEHWVLQRHPQALVVRTNFFGWGHRYRQSFSDWIIASLRAGRTITMFDNIHFTPILADVLAASVQALIERGVSGVMNVAGEERISKYEFALRLAREFGLPGELIARGKLSPTSLPARRPLDMSLDSTRARAILRGSPHSLDGYFQMLREQEAQGRRDELLAAIVE